MENLIRKCTCDHKDQDEMYGNRMRVHTPTEKGYRCTVCLNHKNVDRKINKLINK